MAQLRTLSHRLATSSRRKLSLPAKQPDSFYTSPGFRLREYLQGYLPRRKCLLLDPSIDLSVLSKDEIGGLAA